MTYPPMTISSVGGDGSSETYLSTDEWWSIGGVPLQTYAWNISTWGGSKQGMPSLRGRDQQIPFAAGNQWVPKMVDSRTIDFEGWVVGADGDGTVRDMAKFRTNWAMLKRLFYGPSRQLQIVRRWRDANGTLQAAMGYGQVVRGMEPQSTGPQRAEWSAEVYMADPFFYGDVVEETLAATTDRIITVPGDDATTAVQVVLTGAMGQSSLTVEGPFATRVKYAAVDAGKIAIIDVRDFRATENGEPTTGKVSQESMVPWWVLLPNGSVRVKHTRSGGSAVLRYRPVWL